MHEMLNEWNKKNNVKTFFLDFFPGYIELWGFLFFFFLFFLFLYFFYVSATLALQNEGGKHGLFLSRAEIFLVHIHRSIIISSHNSHKYDSLFRNVRSTSQTLCLNIFYRTEI